MKKTMKMKKGAMIGISVLLLGSVVTGCSAKSGKKNSIEVNMINGNVILHSVKYYDFKNLKLVTSGASEQVHPGSINSTELSFADRKGKVRIVKLNKKLTGKPSKVKVYLSRDKSKYDTYECRY